MQESNPPVSIVMAVYNEEATIEQALKSLEGQGVEHELLVIDDCSTDRTSELLQRYQQETPNLRVLRNEQNLGLAASLNRGIQASQGEYIARMDADDAARPNRLLMQKSFLDDNPSIAVVGGNAQLRDEFFNPLGITQLPQSPQSICQSIVKICPLVHPAVMFRRSFIDTMGGYDERLRRCQDYDLWLRGVDQFQFANLPDIVMDYRVSRSSTLQNDLYSFYVRIRNTWRRKTLLKGSFWAFAVLGLNLVKKVGYVQRSHRANEGKS